MPRKLLACALLLVPLAGCATSNPHFHGGHFISEHKCDDCSETSTAPYNATYVLYQWRTPPKDQPPPQTWIPDQEVGQLYVRGLQRGDKIGFEKGDKDELFAVAGTEKITLEPGRYCWHISQETEYRGLALAVHEACDTFKETVETIIALPLGIVLLVLLLPFFLVFLPFMFFFMLASI
jgi:hypothetical protein